MCIQLWCIYKHSIYEKFPISFVVFQKMVLTHISGKIAHSTHKHRFSTLPSMLKSRSSYLKLLQLLFDHLHLGADHALRVQSLFSSGQQALQLGHQPVEFPDPLGSVFDLAQPCLAALAELYAKNRKHM